MGGETLRPSLFAPAFPLEWDRRALWDTATWLNGLAFRDFSFAETGLPVIKIAELKKGITDKTKRTCDVFDERYRVRSGDVLYSWSGSPETSLDVFVWYGEDGWLNQHIFKVTTAEGVDRNFHIQLLRYLRPNLVAIATNKQTTGLGHVTQKDLRRLIVGLPPLAEQRTIARVLGALDDKIELNRRMNRTLEEMARALFKSWFVDFDPVHANAAGNPTLPPDLAAHFPAEFEPSPIGDVPKGWGVQRFSDQLKAVRGLSYKGSGLCGESEGLPLHNLNSIYEGGGYKFEGIKFYNGSHQEKNVLKTGDMIITNTEQGHEHRLIGHAAIVPSRFGASGLFSHHIYRITPRNKSPLTRHYLCQLFNTSRWHRMIAGYSNGTSINMLPLDAMTMPLLVVRPKKLVECFDSTAAEIHSKSEQAEAETRTLAALRDALLPKLLSGELSVAAAEDANA